MFLMKRTIYWNKIVIRIVHLFLFVNDTINCGFLLRTERYIWMKFSSEFYVYLAFVNDKINLVALVRKELNRWIRFSYKSFINYLFVVIKINYRVLHAQNSIYEYSRDKNLSFVVGSSILKSIVHMQYKYQHIYE